MSRPRRIGLFGLLGSGNLGNDGSLLAMLDHLRAAHPDAEIDALCGGPERVRATYGLDAVPLYRSTEFRTASTVLGAAGKLVAKLGEFARTAAWVRRHDLVIVPGMGVLEATLPLRPWGFPYSLYVLCRSGRLFGTPVALVGVGAEVIEDRAIRWLVVRAARAATVRSYRDELSRDALRAMGVDVSADRVHPDLAFALPTPPATSGHGWVGVGVMAYRGGNADRARAEELYREYVAKLTAFVGRLVAAGRRVRLFVGDEVDRPVVTELRAALPPDAPVVAAGVADLDGLLAAMADVDVVVASRYHNVLAALKLGKPTISLGYAAKNDVLMAEFGLAGFCLPVRAFTVDRLVELLGELERRAPELAGPLAARVADRRRALDDQLTTLSTLVGPRPVATREA